MNGLEERVAATIERYAMVCAGQAVGVAVSGGADSVCLLHVLTALAPRWGLGLSVWHLNHQLRGEESREDAEFVRCLAGRMGLPFHIQEADFAGSTGNLEERARRTRLAFFRAAIETGAVTRMAVGHTRSDQAETVLFRFLRGAGTAGLAGIRPVTSSGLVRPLIEVERAEVEQFLKTRGIPWREDRSNRDRRFARNRIRHELLPQLARDWNPRISRRLAAMADWAAAEESWWEAELNRLSEGRIVERDGAVLMAVEALDLPLAAARRLVRRAMERAKGDLRGIDFDHVEEVVRLAGMPAGACGVPGLQIRRSFGWVRFARAGFGEADSLAYRLEATPPGKWQVPGTGLVLSLELVENPETSELADCVYNIGMGCLDWRGLSGPLYFRNWQAGDQYQPRNSTGPHKIKTLFQRARIPVWDRQQWPVLTAGDEIVWARRFGPAARFAAGTDTKVLLVVREEGIA